MTGLVKLTLIVKAVVLPHALPNLKDWVSVGKTTGRRLQHYGANLFALGTPCVFSHVSSAEQNLLRAKSFILQWHPTMDTGPATGKVC